MQIRGKRLALSPKGLATIRQVSLELYFSIHIVCTEISIDVLTLWFYRLQWCAQKSAALLFQDSGKTVHSAEKNDTSYERAAFFTDMKPKNIQNGRLKKT